MMTQYIGSSSSFWRMMQYFVRLVGTEIRHYGHERGRSRASCGCRSHRLHRPLIIRNSVRFFFHFSLNQRSQPIRTFHVWLHSTPPPCMEPLNSISCIVCTVHSSIIHSIAQAICFHSCKLATHDSKWSWSQFKLEMKYSLCPWEKKEPYIQE